jgi:hypothetical protein
LLRAKNRLIWLFDADTSHAQDVKAIIGRIKSEPAARRRIIARCIVLGDVTIRSIRGTAFRSSASSLHSCGERIDLYSHRNAPAGESGEDGTAAYRGPVRRVSGRRRYRAFRGYIRQKVMPAMRPRFVYEARVIQRGIEINAS